MRPLYIVEKQQGALVKKFLREKMWKQKYTPRELFFVKRAYRLRQKSKRLKLQNYGIKKNV